MHRVVVPSPHPDIRVELIEHIATVTLDRPGSKNARAGHRWVALGAIFTDLGYSGAPVFEGR